jgi:hypothetical protein
MSTSIIADPKGRVTLGREYAGATLLVEKSENGVVTLRPAVTIPAGEAWLWRNREAAALVQAGLDEARQGRHAKPPNLRAANRLSRKIKD